MPPAYVGPEDGYPARGEGLALLVLYTEVL